MKSNFDFEIKKRLENENWDKKIYNSVCKKIDRKKRVDRFKNFSVFLFLVTLSFSSIFYYQSYQAEKEEKILVEWTNLIDDELEIFPDTTFFFFKFTKNQFTFR